MREAESRFRTKNLPLCARACIARRLFIIRPDTDKCAAEMSAATYFIYYAL